LTNVSSERRGLYAFGRFQLSADGTLLVRDGVRVPLAPKVLQTLLVLVENAGRVVTKNDLLQAVWPDSFVEEIGLTRNISLLRQALEDDGRTFVGTVARIGYRFLAPVTRMPATEPAASAPHEPTSDEHRSGPSPKRLLILPFTQLRDDPDTGFLAFSVADAVVTALSGLGSLIVRSSATASRIKDASDLKEIAAAAAVDAIVTGTLLRSGQHLRMSAQLVAVPCGTVLWSHSTQVLLRNVFELQDTLVAHIVRSLSLTLTANEQRRLHSDVPANAAAYEFFLRGNETVGPQGIGSAFNLRVAKQLYTRAVEADPRYAPAWARLARCHYLIGKAEENRDENFALAESCFRRALDLNPDLPLAHNLYALVEIDRGQARNAMVRLLARARSGSVQPELYAALVQATRFCGLLEASVAAHERARQLDSTIATGGYQALWQLGEEDRALREGIRPVLVQAIVAGMRGDRERALEILRDAETPKLTNLIHHLILGLRAVFERRPDVAFEHASWVFDANTDPESLYVAARFIAAFGDTRALSALARALDRGFVIYRVLHRDDPWLDPLRETCEFQDLVARAREVYRGCLQAYVDAGGERVLGPVPDPEEVEIIYSRAATRGSLHRPARKLLTATD
jgi:eukaryotic-like serine/threonine-protein kinase